MSKVYYESDRTYKMTVSGPEGSCRQFSVPMRLGRSLPDDLRFRCELTAEGILYKPENGEPMPVPDWAQNGNGAS